MKYINICKKSFHCTLIINYETIVSGAARGVKQLKIDSSCCKFTVIPVVFSLVHSAAFGRKTKNTNEPEAPEKIAFIQSRWTKDKPQVENNPYVLDINKCYFRGTVATGREKRVLCRE